MTQQEFVKKESEETIYNELGFGMGLTKGLEIGKEFADWTTTHLRRSFPVGAEEPIYFRNGIHPLFEAKRPYTTDELLEIFLTEKYENPIQPETTGNQTAC